MANKQGQGRRPLLLERMSSRTLRLLNRHRDFLEMVGTEFSTENSKGFVSAGLRALVDTYLQAQAMKAAPELKRFKMERGGDNKVRTSVTLPEYAVSMLTSLGDGKFVMGVLWLVESYYQVWGWEKELGDEVDMPKLSDAAKTLQKFLLGEDRTGGFSSLVVRSRNQIGGRWVEGNMNIRMTITPSSMTSDMMKILSSPSREAGTDVNWVNSISQIATFDEILPMGRGIDGVLVQLPGQRSVMIALESA